MSRAPIFHLGLIERLLGGARTLVKRDQQQIGRHHATVEPMRFPAPLDPADNPHIVADHFGFDLGNEVLLQPERVGRPSNSHLRTPPADFLNGAFARIAAATRLFRGDLQAKSKRKSGKKTPYNHVPSRMRSISGTT